jgi:hypothetical protein
MGTSGAHAPTAGPIAVYGQATDPDRRARANGLGKRPLWRGTRPTSW